MVHAPDRLPYCDDIARKFINNQQVYPNPYCTVPFTYTLQPDQTLLEGISCCCANTVGLDLAAGGGLGRLQPDVPDRGSFWGGVGREKGDAAAQAWQTPQNTPNRPRKHIYSKKPGTRTTTTMRVSGLCGINMCSEAFFGLDSDSGGQ
jgi:hypothetical protein